MSGEQALYRFFAADGALLYVGRTVDPAARWRSHRRTQPWWHEVTSITLQRYGDLASIVAAERGAIRTECPAYNVVHNSRADRLIYEYVHSLRDGLTTEEWSAVDKAFARLDAEVARRERRGGLPRTLECPACRYIFWHRTQDRRCPRCHVRLGGLGERDFTTTEPCSYGEHCADLPYLWTGTSWIESDPPLSKDELAQLDRSLSTPGHYGPLIQPKGTDSRETGTDQGPKQGPIESRNTRSDLQQRETGTDRDRYSRRSTPYAGAYSDSTESLSLSVPAPSRQIR